MPDNSTTQRNGIFRTSSLIAFASLLSRVLGFAGDAVKSHFFGAGGMVDAFNVAAAIPTLLNDLLIQSLVNSAYIPVFNSLQAGEIWQVSSALISITSLFFAGAVLLMELFAPLLASMLNGGASPQTQELTVSIMHITIPALFVLNISGIIAALLYARQRVVLPTVATMLFNGSILVSALLLQARFGIFSLALGLLIGTLLQLTLQVAGLRGWQFRPRLWHPGLRRIALLFSPILFGLLVEVFLSRPLTYAMASQTGEGGIAWMGYALTLRQMPEGLIASALSITVLVTLSQVARESLDGFKETLTEGLRLAFILIIPAAVGLFLLAHPITALLFEHGDFTPRDTEVVATALRWYLIGLPFATVDLLLVVSFYARRNTLTPALIGLFTTLIYIGMAKALLPTMGLYSLMFSDSVRFVLHSVISALLLRRSIGLLPNLGVGRTLLESIVAVIVMGVVVIVVASFIPFGDTLLSKAVAVGLPVLAGLGVYLIILLLLGTDELGLLRRLIPH